MTVVAVGTGCAVDALPRARDPGEPMAHDPTGVRRAV